MDAKYGDMLYYCDVRWLSRGAMLHYTYALDNEIATFVVLKGLDVPENTCCPPA